ncbi:hypothetical protein AB0F07_37145 [Streptomyces fructofermentans]|uniref:hypothetical protein n=1 Tax=Streptomyces fructofermentans TaxID=152141 RepID=UPI0033F8D3B2
MDISDRGPRFDPEWIGVEHSEDAGNNVYGTLRSWRGGASAVAERFVGAGWRSRSSSWSGYEVETDWCQVEIDPVENADLLLSGVVDPRRFHELGALLDRFGLRYSLELHGGDGDLVREIHA